MTQPIRTPPLDALEDDARQRDARQARAPVRAIVYGVEGGGQSTFAANAPSPIFLCSEDGTSHLDVARFPTPNSWVDALEAVRVLTHEEHSFKTLAIGARLARAAVLGPRLPARESATSKSSGAARATWPPSSSGELLARLNLLAKTRKMNVVMVAHAAIRRVDDPQTGPFDRYRMKLHDKAPTCSASGPTPCSSRGTRSRPRRTRPARRGRSSGARLLHTQWTAAFDAKEPL